MDAERRLLQFCEHQQIRGRNPFTGGYAGHAETCGCCRSVYGNNMRVPGGRCPSCRETDAVQGS